MLRPKGESGSIYYHHNIKIQFGWKTFSRRSKEVDDANGGAAAKWWYNKIIIYSEFYYG